MAEIKKIQKAWRLARSITSVGVKTISAVALSGVGAGATLFAGIASQDYIGMVTSNGWGALGAFGASAALAGTASWFAGRGVYRHIVTPVANFIAPPAP